MDQKRLQSLDFFRGFTIAGMILVNNPGSWSNVYPPLLHASWNGWTPTDLIFPFFLFIVGVSIVLALSGKKERGEINKDIYIKVVRRTLLLFGLGLFLAAFPYFNFSTLRIPGVLQRIAVCYFIATLIFLHSSVKTQVIWTAAFLAVYWALMEFIPVPDIGTGLYERGANFSNYFDGLFLSGHMWSQTKTWDPEGIISTLPAISTTLFGILTGHLIRSKKSEVEKVAQMLIWGNIAIAVGMAWDHWMPINKSLWTSSYSVFMAGMAMVCLGISYYLIDVKGWQKGIKPFIVYGMNAITVFVLSGLVAKLMYLITWTKADGSEISVKGWIYETFLASWLNPVNASLAFALGFIFISYLAMLFLYKKKIFLKV